MRKFILSKVEGINIIKLAIFTAAVFGVAILVGLQAASANSVSELLGRGLICLPRDGHAYCSWRSLPIDSPSVGFYVYRNTAPTGEFTLLNETTPVTTSTNYYDATAVTGTTYYYKVAVVNSQDFSNLFQVTAANTTADTKNFFDVKIFTETEQETIHHIVPADLNGDGMLDFVVKTPNWNACNKLSRTDPVTEKITRPAPPTKITAMIFKDGFWETKSWRITSDFIECDEDEDFDANPLLAWDLDGDKKAEVISRISEAEFAIINGETGEIVARIPRPMADPNFNNDYDRIYTVIANLRDRNGDGIADPFVVFQNGIFAYKQLFQAYYYDPNDEDHNGKKAEMEKELQVYTEPGSRGGMGTHGLPSADIDNDGKDEIIPCGAALDDDLTIKWAVNDKHNDSCSVSDIRPDILGLETFMTEEAGTGWLVVDSAGKIIWKKNAISGHDCWEEGWCSNLKNGTGYEGSECFAFEATEGNHCNIDDKDSKGNPIPCSNPQIARIFTPFGVEVTSQFITGDPRTGNAIHQSPVDWKNGEGISELYEWGNAASRSLSGWYHTIWADLFGDSREEVVGFNPNSAKGFFRISSNTDPNVSPYINYRRVTPLTDRNYRATVARVGVGYRSNFIADVSNQPRTDVVYSANPPVCTNFEYAPEACQPDGTQKLNIISMSPVGCVGGISPVLSQACTYVPPKPKNEIDPAGTYIEAEDFTGTIITNINDPKLTVESSQAYHLGSGYLNSDAVASNKRWIDGKEYAVNFPTEGSYKIWIRSRSIARESYAVYAGLDGVTSTNTVRLVGSKPSDKRDIVWQWANWADVYATPPDTNIINVATRGPHKINIWAGDYNVLIDGIYLANLSQDGKPPTHVFYGKTLNLAANPADVNSDGHVNIKDIQICIRGIVALDSFTTPDQLNQLTKCKSVAPPETVVNIKDIQAIVREIIGG